MSVPFSLSPSTELRCDARGAVNGLDDAGAVLDSPGVGAGLELAAFDSMALPPSEVRFAGVTLLGVGADFLWKKPAIPSCFGPGFGALELPVFFFCVDISLPSIPRAMTTRLDDDKADNNTQVQPTK